MRFLADEGVDGLIVDAVRDYRQRLHHRGVVLVRVDGISNAEKARLVTRAMREHETDLSGGFTVIQHGTIRIRRA